MARTAIAYLRAGETLDPVPTGIEVVGIVVDEDAERAGLADALTRIADGEADTLLLASLRAAADSLGQLVRLLDWLGQAGACLLSLDLGFDSADGSVGDAIALLREIDGWARDPGPNRRPRGRPGLQHASPELAERISALRGQGRSLEAIAAELNRTGVPTPRGGREWRASSVQSALGYRRPRPPAPGTPPAPGRKPPKPPKPGKPPKHEHRDKYGKHDKPPKHQKPPKHDGPRKHDTPDGPRPEQP